MGVEQYGLGFRVTLGIFYEVEARGIGTKGNACGAQVGACALAAGRPAVIGHFITMKLECSARYYCASSYYFYCNCMAALSFLERFVNSV